VEDGREITLRSRKGAEFTFNAFSLAEHLIDARDSAEPKAWPEYSRKLHDPVADAIPIVGDILLVEGNYLLLPEEPWTEIASLADETVFLDAPEELLRGRLVARKIAGGSSEEEAVTWYESSDGRNVRRVLAAHIPATHELRLDNEGAITRI
ncbi:MAG: hypothetical protein IJH87_02365, partial [Atopobiaceae bacterium]|nr:hypothetical protein [Atopobiaceae bacterium]